MRHLTGARHFLLPGRIAKGGSGDATNAPTVISTNTIRGFVLALAAFALLFSACGGGGDEEQPPTANLELAPKRLTFMAGFKPQANLPFVGVYIAQEKGYFRELNLDVTIRHAQSGEHLQLLLADQVQVTTANGASILKRNDQGLEIVSIALVGQRSEQGFAVLESSGIRSVTDWAGKTFGFKGSIPTEFLAIARANGLDPNAVRARSVGFDPRILSEGQVDILAVFFSNEPGQLERIGHKTRVFDPNDYGIESLGLTYIATRQMVEKDPEALERFLRAALRGIDYADRNREEALDTIMKYAPQEDRDHQRFMLNTELDRAVTDFARKNGIGWQTREQWQRFHDTLLEFEAITRRLDVSTVYTDQFLKRIYKDGKLQWPQ
jgi:ABC-type nitrate/sulfonate/bicarbonate transport system substrate-binding protein